MDLMSIIKLGTQVGGVLQEVLKQLPTRDQRLMEEFYEFEDKIATELGREDADYDDLVIWLDRRRLLLDTIVKTMRGGS